MNTDTFFKICAFFGLIAFLIIISQSRHTPYGIEVMSSSRFITKIDDSTVKICVAKGQFGFECQEIEI